MKKTSVRKKKAVKRDALNQEYRFDYSKSTPNRFAAKMAKGAVRLCPKVKASQLEAVSTTLR